MSVGKELVRVQAGMAVARAQRPIAVQTLHVAGAVLLIFELRHMHQAIE
jgi:hypothetical protein